MTPDEINALRKWAQRHAHMKFLHVSVPISQLLALLTIAERAEGLRAAAVACEHRVIRSSRIV
jgi:hypothetical protein